MPALQVDVPRAVPAHSGRARLFELLNGHEHATRPWQDDESPRAREVRLHLGQIVRVSEVAAVKYRGSFVVVYVGGIVHVIDENGLEVILDAEETRAILELWTDL